MAAFPKWPLIYVEWDDSCGGSQWVHLDGETPDNKPMPCRSVGWLAKKDKRALTLYSDLAALAQNKHPSGHSEQTIPMGCVTRIVKIKQPKGENSRREP